MRISDIGGEFSLIRRLATMRKTKDPSILVGVGDDCAVLDMGQSTYQLVTTDMMVENDHFTTTWFTPAQVGSKLVECNVSDIVSMGGTPAYGTISMSLKRTTQLEYVDELFEGIYASCDRHGISIVGGDTTHGTELVFSMTLIGTVQKEMLRTRSQARPGDAICVTGALGGSAAGLRALTNGIEGHSDKFLNPRSRTAGEGAMLAQYATAMIDVSDGLGSEVSHICRESQVGADIFREKIPVSESAKAIAKILSESPCDYALYGGEDYELVFTVPHSDIAALHGRFKDFSIIGEVLEKKEGIGIVDGEKRNPLEKGFDHFP